jgi:hypothetical protein
MESLSSSEMNKLKESEIKGQIITGELIKNKILEFSQETLG